MRRAGGVLQGRGAEEERRSSECRLGTDAHIRRVGGVLQRRGAEEERGSLSWKVHTYFRIVTGMAVLQGR